jgi:hypothetical protein
MADKEFRVFLQETLYRHCISLRFVHSSQSILHISAFLYSKNDDWYIITAGHCITDLIEAQNDYPVCEINDSLHISSDNLTTNKIMLQINTVDFLKGIQYSNDKDNDWAFFKLSSIYKQPIEANGCVPFTSQMNSENADYFFILGIPSESANRRGYIFSIVRADHYDKNCSGKHNNFKSASIPSNDEMIDPQTNYILESIKGMSGGPVLGIINNGYQLVGIQSSWIPQTRIVKFMKFEDTAENIN